MSPVFVFIVTYLLALFIIGYYFNNGDIKGFLDFPDIGTFITWFIFVLFGFFLSLSLGYAIDSSINIFWLAAGIPVGFASGSLVMLLSRFYNPDSVKAYFPIESCPGSHILYEVYAEYRGSYYWKWTVEWRRLWIRFGCFLFIFLFIWLLTSSAQLLGLLPGYVVFELCYLFIRLR